MAGNGGGGGKGRGGGKHALGNFRGYSVIAARKHAFRLPVFLQMSECLGPGCHCNVWNVLASLSSKQKKLFGPQH